MYDCMITSNSKTPVLTRPVHVNEKLAFSKTSSLGAVFGNLHFRCPKTPLRPSSDTQGQIVGARENFCVFLPNQKAERRRPFGTGLVRHCPQGLFSPFFTFLRAIFSARLDFLLPPLSAPGSPRMRLG